VIGPFAFIHGPPHYAVVVTHLHKGQTVFSAVCDPSIDELFVAEKGKGTTLNGKSVTVNQTNDLCFMYDSEMEATWITKEKRIDVLSKLMDHGRSKAFGSAALTYAYVACGRAQGAIDINKDPFTTFAGELLVEEAGGKVTDRNGQKITLETQGVIASNGAVHELLLDAWNS
jgi:myo-inositol-1(or 4)-monophosphatase